MSCSVDAPEAVPVWVDAEHVVNALLALLENAVRYTPPDTGPERRSIRVRVFRDDSAGVFEIADRGIGIPPEERKRVLEPYYRVRSSLFAKVRGAGLGLSIVRRVAADHHGSLSIHGREPFGTVFRLGLPLPREETGREAKPLDR